MRTIGKQNKACMLYEYVEIDWNCKCKVLTEILTG